MPVLLAAIDFDPRLTLRNQRVFLERFDGPALREL